MKELFSIINSSMATSRLTIACFAASSRAPTAIVTDSQGFQIFLQLGLAYDRLHGNHPPVLVTLTEYWLTKGF